MLCGIDPDITSCLPMRKTEDLEANRIALGTQWPDIVKDIFHRKGIGRRSCILFEIIKRVDDPFFEVEPGKNVFDHIVLEVAALHWVGLDRCHPLPDRADTGQGIGKGHLEA